MSSDPGTTGILMSQRYINMSDKENMKLVQEVEKYPILYNPGLPEYTRRADTDKAWDAVGEVMNLTGPLCKERWKNMRVVLMRSLKQNQTRKKKPYYLADAMKFLLPYLNVPQKPPPKEQTAQFANTHSVHIKVEPHIESYESPEDSLMDDFENQNLECDNSSVSSDEDRHVATRVPNDPVTSFLDSLGPELKEMTFEQFKMFKRRVLALVDDITEQNGE